MPKMWQVKKFHPHLLNSKRKCFIAHIVRRSWGLQVEDRLFNMQRINQGNDEKKKWARQILY